MSCIITYKGQKYSEEQFKEYFINNKQEFATSIAKNKDVIDSFKRKMEGIDFVFSQSPELASIGSKAQYLQYLSTIFKTSKVKDIVYHGTDFDGKIEKFDFSKIGENYQGDNGFFRKGMYFTGISSIKNNYGKNIYSVLLNIKNPEIINNPTISNVKNLLGKDAAKNKDGVLVYRDFQPKETKKLFGKDVVIPEIESGFIEIVVFEPEQIHILSSKKDLEMFRNFINFTKSEYAKYGDIQQFRDYIMSKNFAAIEEFLVVNNKIDRKC